MLDGISVDYMGTGAFMNALHPQLQATNIYGTIPLPTINLTPDTVEYKHRFSLPYPITNPFLQACGMLNVDYYFTPIDVAAGVWELSLVGRVVRQNRGTNLPLEVVPLYNNPVTNNRVASFIMFGGFRG